MKVVIIGSGASGAMAASFLAAAGFDVQLLEAGRQFKPMTRKVLYASPLRRAGLLGSERTISLLLPHLRTSRSGDTVTVRGLGAGGCTVLSCGNIMPSDKGLKEIDLDLSSEFEQIRRLLPTCTISRERWRPTTGEMFDAAREIGLSPAPTPKAVDAARCIGCGMCELGCATGARWDSRTWIDDAANKGACVHYEHEAVEILTMGGKAVGVRAAAPSGRKTIRADTVVLAAGGIGTAQVLRRSGIEVSDTLWIDPVVTLGGVKIGSRQLDEIPMAWFSAREDYMISPYMDLLSHFFQPSWRMVRAEDRVGLMVKLADEANGRVDKDGKVLKRIGPLDEEKISEASELAESIMVRAGVKGPFERGLINGGHLGGTVPLRREDGDSMRPDVLPENLWVADLSLVPRSQGRPTMMLAAALALKVCKNIVEFGHRR